ncbi:MAG: hypothetical protein KA177_06285 [Paludibacter sp.]|nr:hypothetical protein [Paludibacter sp.]
MTAIFRYSVFTARQPYRAANFFTTFHILHEGAKMLCAFIQHVASFVAVAIVPARHLFICRSGG